MSTYLCFLTSLWQNLLAIHVTLYRTVTSQESITGEMFLRISLRQDGTGAELLCTTTHCLRGMSNSTFEQLKAVAAMVLFYNPSPIFCPS